MSNQEQCFECGNSLSAGSDGLCPKCLMAGARRNPEQDSVFFDDTENPGDTSKLAKRFPEYDNFEMLGAGGMGTVYKARHVKLNRTVALKFLKATLSKKPEFAERFLREARTMAQLDHPNIVRVYDFGESSGECFLAMEYVDGTNLRAILMNDGLQSPETLRIIPKICEALEYAHKEGVVHRDIKPENILIDRLGHVKIADFGLAKLMSSDHWNLTETGQAMGTPHYMAPEQVRRTSDVDHRADIFSLGVVFYEMLTGELPLGAFRPPSSTSESPEALDEVVMRTLEKDPGHRYQHASEMQSDVEAVRDAAPQVAVSQRTEKEEAAAKFRRMLVVVFLLLFGGAWAFYLVSTANQNRSFRVKPTILKSPGSKAARIEKVNPQTPEEQRRLDQRAYVAASRGDLMDLQEAITAGGSPNATGKRSDKTDSTALVAAVEGHHFKIVQYLLSVGASASIGNADGSGFAMHAAARLGYSDIVSWLLQYDDVLDRLDHKGRSPLLLALMNHKSKAAHVILDAADKHEDRHGDLPVDLNLSEKASPWKNALYYAIESKDKKLIRRLLKYGTGTTTVEMHVSPLTHSIKLGLDMIDDFKAVGVKIQDDIGALYAAYTQRDKFSMRRLVAMGADVNKVKFGWSLLEGAIISGDVDWAYLLIKLGADPKSLNRKGETMLKLAQKHGNEKMIKLIGTSIQD